MYAWAYLDQAGQEVGRSPHFPDADAAEVWIGTSWRDLFENGVDEVVLYDQARGRKLYRMGLNAE